MKKWFTAVLSLVLALALTSVLAEGLLLVQPLSLADKIKQVKERDYLTSGRSELASRVKTSSELPGVFEMAGGDAFSLGTVKRHDEYSIVNFKSDDPDQLDFARRYVDALVEEQGYTLTHDETRDSKGYRHSSWYLEHPDPEIGQDAPYEEDGRECDVYVVLNQYFEDGDCTLAVYHVNALSHPDSGSAKPGGSSGSGKSYCAYCNNGSCNHCGGSGWLSTWSGTERVKQDCPMCIGGRCTRC